MNGKALKIWLVAIFLLYWHAGLAVSGENQPLSPCPPPEALSQLSLEKPPKRVLLVPLLSGRPDTRPDRWSERPAASIADFYRRRFGAVVNVMWDIWSWRDFYEQAEQIQRNLAPFDRIIFIGHGGFDGPILDEGVYQQNLIIEGDKTELLQFSEAQPGLKNVISIRYDSKQNRQFADYMAAHTEELARLGQSSLWPLLKDLESQLQPLDNACFDHYCSADNLATTGKELAATRIAICRRICRKPLFELKPRVEISPERFSLFAKTLDLLATSNGLIFFGACNPGSAAPQQTPAWAETELLINSGIAGGPYNSYVHLMSAATGRITAGPIGNSSGDDIVNRIMLFESNRRQHYLCIVTPGDIKITATRLPPF